MLVHPFPIHRRRPRPFAFAPVKGRDRDRGAPEPDPARSHVDLPQWVAAFLACAVTIGFLGQVARGRVDPEMYGLMLVVAGAVLGVKAWRGKDL